MTPNRNTTEKDRSQRHSTHPRSVPKPPPTSRQTGISLVALKKQLAFEFVTDEIDVAELDRELDESPVQPWANSTRRAYNCDWKAFAAFCRKIDQEPLPAHPQTVKRYVRWEADQALAAGTIARRLTAIDARHIQTGFPSPCKDHGVALVLANIRRELGTAPKPKAPILMPDLKSMLDQVAVGIQGIRDRALLLVGFGSGCRRSELSALNLGDVTCEPQGLVIRIVRSKTDQEAKGREVAVNRGAHKPTDPARALQAWIAVRGNRPGPLFCRVIRGQVTDQRLSPRAVARVVKRLAKRAGMDPSRYAGHSLRSGCATTAAEFGADILTISRHLGHATTATTEKYIRPGERWKKDLMRGAL